MKHQLSNARSFTRIFALGRGRKVVLTSAFVGLVAIACGSSDSVATLATSTAVPAQAPQVEATAAAEPTAIPDGAGVTEPVGDEPSLVERRELDVIEKTQERRMLQFGWQTDFELRTIRLDELFISLPRDAITPIDEPRYVATPDAVTEFNPKEPVIVVDINDDARAYPLSILVNHEIVNDEIGGVPVTVTFCPLCNSSIVFERTIDGEVHRFGTSGMLRKSDLVMWDDRTETLWQQLTGEGIVGEQAGKQLTFVPAQVVSFDEFAANSPDGLVLVPPRNQPYLRSSYQGYDDIEADDPFLFSGDIDRRLPATSRVAALDLGSGPVAYSFELLAANPALNVVSGDLPVAIFFDDTTESAFRSADRGRSGEINISGSATTYLREVDGQVLTFTDNGDGTFRDDQTGSIWDRFGEALEGELAGSELLPVIHGDHFWFAWAAFQPDTELITEISQITQS